eukprot:CAMPEP_0196811310 /NCGR_PEP_ID=MMETSP1362-20130617/17070_1 /TAXON_ID=163516 /ORGANISM="Leptocylindrus danicus, Strain CCMP1856" /LENGTH=263 /DNA_ID=CAMNT_0042186589 /DNA_START=78 /DNA_END=869 /DNA_ORIENTATION=+
MNTTAQEQQQQEQQDKVLLDIHIPLTKSQSCAARQARASNLYLRNHDGAYHQEIDFPKLHTPHATLYQTQFYKSDLPEIKSTVENIAAEFLGSYSTSRNCEGIELELTHKISSGNYAMLDIAPNPCLRKLSDVIVQSLLPYVVFPAEIPEWVHHIKNAKQRARKMELVQLYGSPNVLDEFQPHVTVGYNEVDPSGQRTVFLGMDTHGSDDCAGVFDTVAIGFVGIGGSVLHGPLYEAKLTPSSSSSADADPDADADPGVVEVK